MSNLQLRRWTKHGHDRLYVKTAKGLDLGWISLRSGHHGLKYPGMGTEVMSAVERWKREHPGWSQARQQRPTGLPRTRQAPADRDLAANRPGAALKDKAKQLQIRNPVLRVLARLLGVRTRDRAWKVGAKGEEKVGGRLDKLASAGWRVLHNVDLGGRGDIDHLVIGRFGVFTINTKHHPRAFVQVHRSKIIVRRKEQPYVGKAHREADRVHRALSAELGRPVNVTPLIVVHGHARLAGWLRHRPQGVQVLPSWLVRWWFRLPGRALLRAEEVETLYKTARHSPTWHNA